MLLRTSLSSPLFLLMDVSRFFVDQTLALFLRRDKMTVDAFSSRIENRQTRLYTSLEVLGVGTLSVPAIRGFWSRATEARMWNNHQSASQKLSAARTTQS